jgi:hypothetical protein
LKVDGKDISAILWENAKEWAKEDCKKDDELFISKVDELINKKSLKDFENT